MTLKFSRKSSSRKQSTLQRIQWDSFAALGYSMAIKGYLLCWRQLLIRAQITDIDIIWAVDNAITMSKEAEKRARWNLKHLRSLKP